MRPCPSALWSPGLGAAEWGRARLSYIGAEQGGAKGADQGAKGADQGAETGGGWGGGPISLLGVFNVIVLYNCLKDYCIFHQSS